MTGLPDDITPMEARSAAELPVGDDWRYEPKWDGFRCLAYRDGTAVHLAAKSGKPLGRYFPDMVAALKALPIDRFILDGELTIAVDGRLSFDALQARLHPAASRVNTLAAEQPARLILFDCLATPDGVIADQPLAARRAALERLYAALPDTPALGLSPETTDPEEAARWLSEAGGDRDGVVAKRGDLPYRPGERAMIKVKRIRTADCVVGGYRMRRDKPGVGSLLLGLYDDEGRLNHVGFTAAIRDAERPALTKRLEALRGPSAFTGSAPGGPSRWSRDRDGDDWIALKPELVAEVRFDHVSADRFRHGTTLVRFRPDKAPAQCRMEQLHG